MLLVFVVYRLHYIKYYKFADTFLIKITTDIWCKKADDYGAYHASRRTKCIHDTTKNRYVSEKKKNSWWIANF